MHDLKFIATIRRFARAHSLALFVGMLLCSGCGDAVRILLMSLRSNSLSVRAEGIPIEGLSIKYGIWTISRKSDAELFDYTDPRIVDVFTNGESSELITDYGENDFLVNYRGTHYFWFRQFITNRNYRHDYLFTVHRCGYGGGVCVKVAIDGPNAMSFDERLLPIASAAQRSP